MYSRFCEENRLQEVRAYEWRLMSGKVEEFSKKIPVQQKSK